MKIESQGAIVIMKMATGWDNTVQLLIDALGLRGGPIQRVVIDIGRDDVVKVYVKQLLSVERMEALAGCLTLIQLQEDEFVSVADDCTVRVVSKEEDKQR